MIRLHNDYNRGACEKILEKLAQIKGESYDGYGEDTWCEKAAKLIQENVRHRKLLSTFYQELHRLTSLSTRQL